MTLSAGSSGGKGAKAAGSVVGSQLTRNPASVDSQMNLALSVAENVMGGRSPTLRWVVSYLLRSFPRRMSVKPAEEEKGIFKRKKNTEPVMVFSFSAEEVAGNKSRY